MTTIEERIKQKYGTCVDVPVGKRIPFFLRSGMGGQSFTHRFATEDWTIEELLGCEEYLKKFKRFDINSQKNGKKWYKMETDKIRTLKDLSFSLEDDELTFYNY